MRLINVIKKNNLLKSSILYTVGSLLIKGINFFTFPIFSRMLSPGEYGSFNIFTVWVGFISVFGGLQLNSSIAKGRVKFNKKEYDELIITIISFTTTVFGVLTLISILFSKTISEHMGLNSNLILLATIQSFFSCIISIYSIHLIQNKEDKKCLTISFVVTILNVVISFLLVLLMKHNKYIGLVLGGVLSNLLIGSIVYFKATRGKLFITKKCLKYALKLSVPVIPHVLSQQVLINADRIFIERYIGNEAVGIYGFIYNIGMVVNLLWGGINNAWIPWYFDNLKENNIYEINKMIKKYINIFTLIVISFMIVIPEIGKMFAPSSYWQGIKLIPIIILSYYCSFLYNFSVNLEFYVEKVIYIPIGTIIAGGVNVLLNIILIPKYGMVAASITTLVSYIVLFIIHLLVVRYLIKYDDKNVSYYFGALFLMIIVTGCFYLIMDFIIIRYVILMGILYLLLKVFKNFES
ncbi:lipopolysaccharide biosynthesis protein [Clostridium sp. MB05]|uniref:lipopolysaccharide biosynthesis protein n=1 Tax=Clostridium sp. MB05 TaxID=3376682 RepID=UPI0039826999